MPVCTDCGLSTLLWSCHDHSLRVKCGRTQLHLQEVLSHASAFFRTCTKGPFPSWSFYLPISALRGCLQESNDNKVELRDFEAGLFDIVLLWIHTPAKELLFKHQTSEVEHSSVGAWREDPLNLLSINFYFSILLLADRSTSKVLTVELHKRLFDAVEILFFYWGGPTTVSRTITKKT